MNPRAVVVPRSDIGSWEKNQSLNSRRARANTPGLHSIHLPRDEAIAAIERTAALAFAKVGYIHLCSNGDASRRKKGAFRVLCAVFRLSVLGAGSQSPIRVNHDHAQLVCAQLNWSIRSGDLKSFRFCVFFFADDVDFTLEWIFGVLIIPTTANSAARVWEFLNVLLGGWVFVMTVLERGVGRR